MPAEPARDVSALDPRLTFICSRLALLLALLAVVSFSTGASAQAATTMVANTDGQAAARWRTPVGAAHDPIVVNGFDPPAARWLAGHRGVDLRAASGEPVYAAGSGEVTFASRIVDRGVVVVSHGLIRTTYEPVDATITVGSRVGIGHVLGTVGVGGHCSGGCLHWGLRRGDAYLDPLLLLHRLPPVLKPPRTHASRRSMTLERPSVDGPPPSPALPTTTRVKITESQATASVSAQTDGSPVLTGQKTSDSRSLGVELLAIATAVGISMGIRSRINRR
jgi:hypothetical protein